METFINYTILARMTLRTVSISRVVDSIPIYSYKYHFSFIHQLHNLRLVHYFHHHIQVDYNETGCYIVFGLFWYVCVHKTKIVSYFVYQLFH
jgi:hypothetical protein